MMPKTSVLIPDGESPFAYHVLTCLAQAGGFEIHVFSRQAHVMSRYSLAKKSFHIVPDEKDLLNYVEMFCSHTPVDLILPVDMNSLLFFAKQRELVKEIPALCLMESSQTLQRVSDKGLLAKFLQENQIPHPQTITNLAEFNKLISEFSMPVLIKPRTSGNGEGISKHSDCAELIRLVKEQDNFFDEYLIQEYMDGDDIDCSVLCKDGEILAYTIQKTLFPPVHLYQPADGIEFIQDDQVLDVATRLMKRLRWNGIAHIDMRRRKSNLQVEVIEINPRFWGSIQGSFLAGVNFPQLLYKATMGETFPLPTYQNIKYMSIFSAIKRIQKRQPITHLIHETNLLTMLRDPLPKLMKLAGRAK